MPRNYRQFFAICKRHGFNYKDKVAEFTGGRTDSLTSLSEGEFKEMMLRMVKLNAPFRKGFIPKAGDIQRKKMIAIARDMRWDAKGIKIMMERINQWCLTKTKYRKALNELTVDQLNKTLHVFEHEVKASYYKGLNK